MAVVYIITNTEGSDEFAIQPGTLNGPDGVQQNTDLRLPGNGLAIWGEAYNENIYRLTESFAVPEKELNDFNPATGLDDYDPATDPILPKDENDLGPGNGINVPLEGQVWWNRTKLKHFVFGGTEWSEPNVVGSGPTGDVPGTCATGDLFFDITEQQLLVCGGSGFVSTADQYLRLDGTRPMIGDIDMDNSFRIINLPPPSAGTDAINRDYADNTFVDAAGDTMSGVLNMDGNEIENVPTPAPFTGGDEAASRDYVDNIIATLSLAAEIGDVRMTVDQVIIPGWLECDGATIGNGASGATHVVANALLFDIVKLGFGNGGGESFAGNDTVFLPDFRGRGPINRGTGDTRQFGGGTFRSFGVKYGAEDHTMTIPEMPSHTHLFDEATNVFNLDTHVHNRLVTFLSRPQTPTSATGGDGPHNNMSPSLTVLFLIKT